VEMNSEEPKSPVPPAWYDPTKMGPYDVLLRLMKEQEPTPELSIDEEGVRSVPARCMVDGNQSYCRRLAAMRGIVVALKTDPRTKNMATIDTGDMTQKTPCAGMNRELEQRMSEPVNMVDQVLKCYSLPSASQHAPLPLAVLKSLLALNTGECVGGKTCTVSMGSVQSKVGVSPIDTASTASWGSGLLAAILPTAFMPSIHQDTKLDLDLDRDGQTDVVLRMFGKDPDDSESKRPILDDPHEYVAETDFVEGTTSSGTDFVTRASSVIELVCGVLTTRLVTNQISPFFPLTLAVGSNDKTVGMVMENAGQTLASTFLKLSPQEIDSILIQAVLAVGAMGCAAGIVHNDLHAQNVLVQNVAESDEQELYFSFGSPSTPCIFECSNAGSSSAPSSKPLQFKIPLHGRRVSIIDFGLASVKRRDGSVMLASDAMGVFSPEQAAVFMADLFMLWAALYALDSHKLIGSRVGRVLLDLPIKCSTMANNRSRAWYEDETKILMDGTFHHLLEIHSNLEIDERNHLPHISNIVKCIMCDVPFERLLYRILIPFMSKEELKPGRIVYPVLFPRGSNALFSRSPIEDDVAFIEELTSAAASGTPIPILRKFFIMSLFCRTDTHGGIHVANLQWVDGTGHEVTTPHPAFKTFLKDGFVEYIGRHYPRMSIAYM
jgi:hypothetical protein